MIPANFRQFPTSALFIVTGLTCTLRNYFKLSYRNEPRFHTSGLIFAPSLLSYSCLLRHVASVRRKSFPVSHSTKLTNDTDLTAFIYFLTTWQQSIQTNCYVLMLTGTGLQQPQPAVTSGYAFVCEANLLTWVC